MSQAYISHATGITHSNSITSGPTKIGHNQAVLLSVWQYANRQVLDNWYCNTPHANWALAGPVQTLHSQ